ncbi:MAG TPA: cation:proton antiporter [Candidatus Limnocylindrales bacterium]
MFDTLLVIVVAGLVGPLLAAGRRPLLPAIVGELTAGAILGRSGIGLIDAASPTAAFLYALGFAMLMLVAGSRVQLRGPGLAAGLRSAAIAFAVVALLAVLAGFAIGRLLAPSAPLALWPVLLAGSSAAVAFPILEERGLLGPATAMLLAWIPIADAATVLLMPLTLIGPERIPGALAGDAAIVLVTGAALTGGRWIERFGWVVTLSERSRSRGWALQLRVTLLLLLVLSIVADRSGGSLLLAGFGAGLVLARLREPERLEVQLSGLAEGFFVPAFFVLLGARLDFRALAGDPGAIGLAVVLAGVAIAIHLAGALVAAPRPKVPFGLAASAQLGLPAAAAALGASTGHLSPAAAAAIVAAGCLTVVPSSIGTRRLADAVLATPAASGQPATQEVGP